MGSAHPAAFLADFDTAPVAFTFQDACDDLFHHPCRQCRTGRRFASQRLDSTLNDDCPLTRQHGAMYPTLGPLPIPDFPPVLELGDDLNRHMALNENPVDRIAHPGPGPEMDLIRTERRKTGQRQTGIGNRDQRGCQKHGGCCDKSDSDHQGADHGRSINRCGESLQCLRCPNVFGVQVCPARKTGAAR